ncbi:MAG: SDR family oxidoreductase [Alphaproteobacteria bacterium]|nr:SDR family oxidoreductase [Alphaproteobacteria bacterium]
MIVLISGGNRGLGLETARQLAGLGHTVVLGARDPAKGKAAAAVLGDEGLTADWVPLEVTDGRQAAAAVDDVVARHGRLDVLINNAGILPEMGSVLKTTAETMTQTLAVNVVAPLRLAQLAIPHMKKRRYGRIVNVSSFLGQMGSMGAGQGAYRISKASLNAVTVALDAELGDGPVKVNSASPGWTRTDMGGPSATNTIEEGADTIVWLATLPDDGPTGGFFHARELIDW